MTFEEFILAHRDDDTAKLLLSAKKFPGIDVSLAVNTIESRRKLRKKVPEWYAETGLALPSPLSAEQCSSTATAAYKAALVQRIAATGGRPRLADLTGGLGVDTVAFSKICDKVLYNEMSETLVEAAKRNFALLGADNVLFSCRALEEGTLEDILDGFGPDVIFLDPARRDSASRKVFRLEDCSPDITVLCDELLAAARYVLVKISPMADVSVICHTLQNIREIHIVETAGECKELLILLDREPPTAGSPLITAVSLPAATAAPHPSFSFRREEETSAAPSLMTDSDFAALARRPAAGAGPLLFEPGRALAKSGAFNLISSRSGLKKLDVNTHLYVGEEIPEDLTGLGKTFTILGTAPLSRQSMKDFGRMYPRAEVSARNIPMTSELLRGRLGCASGGNTHIFGVSVASQKHLIAAESR